MSTAAVIVEWENILTAEADRVVQMLIRLDQQISEINDNTVPEHAKEFLKSFANGVEVLIVHGPDVSRSNIEEILNSAVKEKHADYKILNFEFSEYYTLKNVGVENSTTDFVIFVDSDVIPDEHWLSELLYSFHDEKVQIVGGQTYITTESSYSKAYACGIWLWPLRSTTPTLTPGKRYYANNVAMRRKLAEKYPFAPKAFEKRCANIYTAEQLLEDNIPIYRNTAAQCSHPPPYGIHEFFVRAFCYGSDFISKEAHEMGFNVTSLMKAFRRYFKFQWFAMKNIVTRRQLLEMKIHESIMSLFLMTIFNLVQLIGEICVLIAPNYFLKKEFMSKA